MRAVKRKSVMPKDAVQLQLGYRDTIPRDPVKRALELAYLASQKDARE
jgi:hypothetical protein